MDSTSKVYICDWYSFGSMVQEAITENTRDQRELILFLIQELEALGVELKQ